MPGPKAPGLGEFECTTTLYMNRQTQGNCPQCKTVHDRDNLKVVIKSSSKRTTRNSPANEEYILSFVCMRYSKKDSFCYKKAGKLKLQNGEWTHVNK